MTDQIYNPTYIEIYSIRKYGGERRLRMLHNCIKNKLIDLYDDPELNISVEDILRYDYYDFLYDLYEMSREAKREMEEKIKRINYRLNLTELETLGFTLYELTSDENFHLSRLSDEEDRLYDMENEAHDREQQRATQRIQEEAPPEYEDSPPEYTDCPPYSP